MADNTFMLEVVTPEDILLKEEIQFLVVPGSEGELGILKNHAPIVASLKIGVLKYKMPDETVQKVAVSGGFMEVIDNVARVLAETAEHGASVDVLRAKAARERAEKRLAQRVEGINNERAKLALQRAIARIKAAS
ncbi:MAG: F0F1 ATP synthase subunit epsilon [Syntrophomonadaceae bacterium]|jgi:F-type H+-transporting ATPase subunit epsilon|nr:F0F1 ATP synthase subunit epsilon [Syntrophomonadaceae bacterium]